jgi:hypothetical protein
VWGAVSTSRSTVVAATLAALCSLGLSFSTTAARGEPTVEPAVALRAALIPERLGAGTTIKFSFTIAVPAGQAPVPARSIDLLYPANLGIATSGLGLSTCRASTLEALGPPGCPSDSVMGYGSGTVQVPFGPEVLRERTRMTTFMAPVENGHLGLLFYANGESPVSAQLVFPGLVLPADAPFGGELSTQLPLVPTVPEAPDAALVALSTTIGPSHITYYEYIKGHFIPYHPRGILLPRTCPHGGFRFAAQFAFENGTRADAHTTVPCPRR